MVENAKNVVIYLNEDTENYLEDRSNFSGLDEDGNYIKIAIYYINRIFTSNSIIFALLLILMVMLN